MVKNIFEEIMAEIFPKLKKDTETQVQKVQRGSNNVDRNRPTRHIIIKMTPVKYKEEILKAARDKQGVLIKEPT